MAKYSMGFLGPFHGKLGTAVGSSSRGVNYLRSMPKKIRNPRTPAQVQTRANLKLASRIASHIRPVADIAHTPQSVRMGPQAYTVRQLLGPAGLKADPNTGAREQLTPGALDLTAGRGPALIGVTAKIEAGQLKVTWTPAAGSAREVHVALASRDGHLGASRLRAAQESDGTASLPLAADLAAAEHSLVVVCARDAETRKCSPTVAIIL